MQPVCALAFGRHVFKAGEIDQIGRAGERLVALRHQKSSNPLVCPPALFGRGSPRVSFVENHVYGLFVIVPVFHLTSPNEIGKRVFVCTGWTARTAQLSGHQQMPDGLWHDVIGVSIVAGFAVTPADPPKI